VTGITIKEGAMNTNSSGNSCELTDDELDAVNGGALDGYYMSFGCVSGRVSPEELGFCDERPTRLSTADEVIELAPQVCVAQREYRQVSHLARSCQQGRRHAWRLNE
jgi:hypothetical protein